MNLKHLKANDKTASEQHTEKERPCMKHMQPIKHNDSAEPSKPQRSVEYRAQPFSLQLFSASENVDARITLGLCYERRAAQASS